MHALVIANGTPPGRRFLRRLAREADLIVCADGGARAAAAAGLRPHWVVGDFDSASPEQLADLEANGAGLRRFPRRKDETDLELALTHALTCGARSITIVGALGGRLDQTLGNLELLAMPSLREVPTRIRDEWQEVQLIQDEGTIRGEIGDTVSLLPLAREVVGITTTGLEWALQGDTLTMGAARGVSNVMTAPVASVRIQAGLLIAVHLHRPHE